MGIEAEKNMKICRNYRLLFDYDFAVAYNHKRKTIRGWEARHFYGICTLQNRNREGKKIFESLGLREIDTAERYE
jgi:hypothetical protein